MVAVTAKEWYAYVTGAVLTLVWAAVAITDVIVHDYAALTLVTPPFMLLIGWLFGVKIVKKDKGGE